MNSWFCFHFNSQNKITCSSSTSKGLGNSPPKRKKIKQGTGTATEKARMLHQIIHIYRLVIYMYGAGARLHIYIFSSSSTFLHSHHLIGLLVLLLSGTSSTTSTDRWPTQDQDKPSCHFHYLAYPQWSFCSNSLHWKNAWTQKHLGLMERD